MRDLRSSLIIGIVLWCIVFSLSLGISTGCHRKVVVTNVPAGVSQQSVQNWLAAAGGFQLAGKYTNQLAQATVALHTEFPDEDTYQKTLAGFAAAAQVGIQASTYLESVPQHWDQPIAAKVQAYTTDFNNQLAIALTDGLTHVKNKDKLVALQTTINLLNGVLKTIAAISAPTQTEVNSGK